MDLSVGWGVELKKLSCTRGFLLPESLIVTEELELHGTTAKSGMLAVKLQMGKQDRDWHSHSLQTPASVL